MKPVKMMVELKMLVPDDTEFVTMDGDGEVLTWEENPKYCTSRHRWMSGVEVGNGADVPSVLNWKELKFEV